MKRKMEFEEFANAVVENISERLPESFQTAKISLQMVMKNNDLRLTGLTIRRPTLRSTSRRPPTPT